MDFIFHKRKQIIFEDVGKAQSSSQSPYQAVASGVFQINTALNDYRRLVNMIGTEKDTPDHRDNLHSAKQRICHLVKETTANLKVLRERDHGVGVNTKKIIEDAKLARDYQETLQEFQKLQVLDIGREAAFQLKRKQDDTGSHVEFTAAKTQFVRTPQSMNSKPSWVNFIFGKRKEKKFQDLEKGGATSSSSQSIYHAVAQGLFQIDAALIDYLKLVNMVGTDKDTPDSRRDLHTTKQRIGQLMKETSANLKRLRDSDQGVRVDTNEIIEAKLARDFLAILQDYQIIQGLAIEREAADFTPESYGANEQLGPDVDPERRPFLEEYKRQRVIMLKGEIVLDETIRDDQSDIKMIHDICRDLAVLIHDQDAIASRVKSTDAQIQLVKVSKSVKPWSSWYWWVLIIVALVLVIVLLCLV